MSGINSSISIVGTAGDPSNFPLRITARDGSLVSWIDDQGFAGGNLSIGGGGSAPVGNIGDVQFNNGSGGFTNADGISSGFFFNLDPDTGQLQIVDTDSADGVVIDPSTGVVIKCSATNVVSIQDIGGNLLNVGGPSSTLDGILIQATADSNSGININGHKIGFFGTSPITKPTITGAKAGNTAVAGIIAQLVALGLVIDGTT